MPRNFSLLKGLTISRLSWAWKKGFDGACRINHASSKEIKKQTLIQDEINKTNTPVKYIHSKLVLRGLTTYHT